MVVPLPTPLLEVGQKVVVLSKRPSDEDVEYHGVIDKIVGTLKEGEQSWYRVQCYSVYTDGVLEEIDAFVVVSCQFDHGPDCQIFTDDDYFVEGDDYLLSETNEMVDNFIMNVKNVVMRLFV